MALAELGQGMHERIGRFSSRIFQRKPVVKAAEATPEELALTRAADAIRERRVQGSDMPAHDALFDTLTVYLEKDPEKDPGLGQVVYFLDEAMRRETRAIIKDKQERAQQFLHERLGARKPPSAGQE